MLEYAFCPCVVFADANSHGSNFRVLPVFGYGKLTVVQNPIVLRAPYASNSMSPLHGHGRGSTALWDASMFVRYVMGNVKELGRWTWWLSVKAH